MATIYPQIFGRERKNLELSLVDTTTTSTGFIEHSETRTEREREWERDYQCGECSKTT